MPTLCGIPAQTPACEITREQRARLVESGQRTASAGGRHPAPDRSRGHPGRRQREGDQPRHHGKSRKFTGLYVAGELLDVDAMTGGFNLQIAFSTGHLAGRSAAEPAAL